VPTEIGRIEALFRYPVKSMRGMALEAATLGWHGVDGDRRFAFRRLDDHGDFPWLTAGKAPQLVLFTPRGGPDAPTHVLTPAGEELPIFSGALAAEVGRRFGTPVEMMRLRNGTFDDATISVITSDTVGEVSRVAGRNADVRRFRPNVLVRSLRAVPFEEDEWVGGVLTFGDAADAPAVAVTLRDVRCAMVNIDPDSGSLDPEMMRAVVRANQNNAGIYGTVIRGGRLALGQTVLLHRTRLD
jgi:uncharacterized protein YcbX